MIRSEIVIVDKEQKMYTYSDSNMLIHGGFPEGDYDDAVDPIDSGRTYVETDIPIEWDTNKTDYTTIAKIITDSVFMMPREHAYKLIELIHKASESLSDSDALQAVELFDEWKPDTDYERGDRRRYEGVLYKARQAHTSQSIYPPNTVPALWEVVAPEGKGDSPDNPIVYDQSMAIEKGKYYIENDVIYICIRDSGVPLYTALVNVIGNYVEVYVGE